MTPTARPAPYLLTGATGFAGRHLARALLARGEAVVGQSRRNSADLGFPCVACDLLDADAVRRMLDDVRPRGVFHLAGFASAAASFRDPVAAWQGNLYPSLHLIEAVRRCGFPCRVVFAGSGMVYGSCDRPLTEDDAFAPDSPYAASKAAADLLCRQAAASQGVDVVIARPFNHAGPGQSATFALPSFAAQLAAGRRAGGAVTIHAGNLDAERDLSDVRDVADAYIALMQRGATGRSYNVGSGSAVSMREVLRRLIAVSGLDVRVETKAALLRPGESMRTEADITRITAETGWRPRVALDRTLADILSSFEDADPRVGRQEVA